MPPPPHQKPENVLKRAQELIGVDQSQAALSLLHEHVTSKRTRNSPIASLEPVMVLFVELCVDLRKGKSAKDGLYSYKNTAQNTNVATIEMVLKHFIELAEAKVAEAQEKADQVQSTLESSNATISIDDLEASETPESILLSTVSGEQSRDRTDRAIVTPWLKFLWETYRTVLDILKNNARLEVMYQSTAYQAFKFCQKYARKTEFRRLCELLRNHLQNAAKYQSQVHAINLNDPDTLQRHLDTRFQQLNVAVELELWQEAFRSVEDIHTLLSLSKRPAKNIMMANYFEQLSTIFLVSENYLFHAAAFSRYYNLMRGSAAAVASGQSPKKDNPVVTEDGLAKTASFVILSALSIPVISTSRSRGALVDVDEARKNKNQRLTNLLGLNTAPTRASLFKEIIGRGLLKRAKPEIRELYNILEVDFHPLSICKKISPILSQIGADAELGKYVLPLQQVILTRLFQQLSQVYESVDLKFVQSLAQFPEPFQVDSATIEKFIMNGCKKGDLAIRIDHATGVLTFDSDVFSAAKALHPGSGAGSSEAENASVQRLQSTPAEIVRSQLTRLAKALFTTCQYVDPDFTEDQRKARAAALQRAEAGAEKEHSEALERRGIIERNKLAASSAQAQKEKEEANRKRLKAQQLAEAESLRLIEEQKEREQRRIRLEQQRVQREEVEKQLIELKQGVRGVDISELDIDDLDTGRIRQLKIAALEKEKNDLSERLRVTGKRLDHLERAFRREELQHLADDYEAQRKRDRTEYDATTKETMVEAEQKHKDDVALKRRLQRLIPAYETFRDQVRTQRHTEFEKRRKVATRELESQKQARIKEFRERKAREKRDREEREAAEREAAEREEREAEAKAAAEEEKRRKMAEEKVKRDEERSRLDEVAAKQRQREEEAEARRKAGAGSARPPVLSRPSEAETSRGPPRIGGGTASGWRERAAAKAAAPVAETSATPSSPAPVSAEPAAPAAPTAAAGPSAPASPAPIAADPVGPKKTAYVPVHMRSRLAAGAPPTTAEHVLEAPPAAAPTAGGSGWRTASGAGGPRRDENTGSRYSAPGRGFSSREGAESPAGRPAPLKDGGRTFSGRGDAPPARTDSPATNGAPAAPAAGGAYRPGAFKTKTQQ